MQRSKLAEEQKKLEETLPDQLGIDQFDLAAYMRRVNALIDQPLKDRRPTQEKTS